ncbi:MAG TPA: DUF4159 domain-containing protein [Candidatus Dormibacteraeota bacterium]|nr:DUF4159 domain-containing protein [Candidatus Dormibacteraeota bacterium]
MNRTLLWQAVLLALVMACALPSRDEAASRELELNGGFTIARLKYTGGGDWYSDESSLRNLLRAVKERGDVRVSQDREAVVTPTDPEIWNYPMLFMTGHGNIKMSEEEARALRSYLDSGGLLWADDNFGMDKSFRELVKRLYPEAPLTELPFNHAIFRYPSSFPAGAPKVHEHDGGPARVFGVIKGGRLLVLYTFDCDIGNGIEDAGIYDDPAEKRAAALRFAVNVATYAVTH